MRPLSLSLALTALLNLPAASVVHAHGEHTHEGEPHEEASREQGAHEHGAARLDVALTGDVLELQIDGATYNFVGFERAPEGADEIARVEQARLLLDNPSALFGWDAGAGCTAQSSKVETLLPEPASDHAHDDDHDHDHGQGAHGNWRSYHRFSCSRPEALGAIEVRLFQHFPELKRLDFQLVTDTAQTGGRLEPGQSVIRLRP
jgi:hypothetical protein